MERHAKLAPGLLFFAYGCHMDRATLGSALGREPGAAHVGWLDGWRLVFNKGGEGESAAEVVANLMEQPGCATYGVVYRVSREALRALDEFEGVPEHYRRATLWAQPRGRRARQAVLVYLARDRWIVPVASPPPQYLARLLTGAERHGLPDAYRDWLRALAGGRAPGCFPAPR